LIGDISELNKFSIVLSESQKNTLEKYWFASSGVEGSNPTSIVLDCDDDAFTYLHRGTKTLAFRLPAQKDLQNLLLKTGPLIAPSANLEGLPPARNISEARGYFGDLVDPVRGREGSQQPSTSNGVDLYVDGGEITSKASRVIRLNKDCSVEVLRD
jgi:tRNA A37 threonylcarbamoyladenosine synthetase subunit TsaC/SUA5/YrdC